MSVHVVLEEATLTDRGIPVILCYPEGTDALPLVLLNHGTSGSATDMLDVAYRLAQRGCFAVSVDAVWHGRRGDGNLEERLAPEVYKQNYLNMLLEMAGDMSALIDYFRGGGNPRADGTRVGMTGISQGGYVAFMTLTKESRVTAAAPMIGSPDLTDLYGRSLPWEDIAPDVRAFVEEHNPVDHFSKMASCALLVQNCEDDLIVPPSGTRKLDQRIKPLYAGREGDYRYIEYPGLGHVTPRAMKECAVAWLVRKLIINNE